MTLRICYRKKASQQKLTAVVYFYEVTRKPTCNVVWETKLFQQENTKQEISHRPHTAFAVNMAADWLENGICNRNTNIS